MDSAINLKNQALLHATKIYDKLTEWNLSSELKTFTSTTSQCLPKYCFRLGHCFA